MSLGNFGVDIKEDKPKAINDEKLAIDTKQIREESVSEEIERYLPWFLKYQVEKLDDLIITKEIQKVLDYVEYFSKGKALLLVGPPGSGKTTTVSLVAQHYNYELYELNASDSRSKKAIGESIGDVIKQKSLFGQDKLVLVDEVDGVSGKHDRGGVAELSKFVKVSNYPLIFTANDPDSDKIKALKKVATVVNFENHSQEILVGIAQKIFKAEKIVFDQKELETFIDERNTTDIRGFINDLQASVTNSKFSPSTQDMELRDYKKKVEQLLDKIYFSYPEESYKGGFNTDINLDDLMLYVEENTPSIVGKQALALTMNEISKADVYKGRIMKWQYWRYLVYINFYLTYGISASKGENLKKITYKKNQRILKKWIYGNKVNALRARTKTEKGKAVDLRFIERLAKYYGRSANRTRKEDLYYFMIQYRNNEAFKKEMDQVLEIEPDVEKALLTL